MLSRPQVEPCVPAFPRQLKDASTHRSTFCGLRSAFQQSLFPINWERLDASVFTSMLPATKRRSRTCATRATDVISERKHCSRRRRHTQVKLSSSFKCADKTQTIARKRWQGASKRTRCNVRSTCGRLYMHNNITLFFPKWKHHTCTV